MSLIQPLEVVQGGINRPAPTDLRLDKNLISAHIEDAEYQWVIPAIGKTLYSYLKANKGTSTAFSNNYYQGLWNDHLKELCATSVLYEASPYIVVQAGTNGLYTINNDYGQNVGIDGVKFYQDTLKQRIEVKQKRVKDYLCTCAVNFTGFVSAEIDCQYCSEENNIDPTNWMGIIIPKRTKTIEK